MTPDEAALTCIICGNRLEPAFPDHGDMGLIPQPSKGTWFTSHGQYGSTVFDESDGTYLLITICDNDMISLAEAGLILLRRPGWLPQPEPETSTWSPWQEGREWQE